MSSAQILLKESLDKVDIFDIPTEDGVKQLAWSMKTISKALLKKSEVVEVAMNATYNTDAKHLELYTIIIRKMTLDLSFPVAT
ncbi:hypothetical protein CYLTODRAFT_460229 [Cylindrobasidium torrendii FP15055 ss-10]|uniref:Uncharacterized protein n=1 Tax=Cylindrobasidium torrendii FP15055 ss-10 TaxID=1314674 RepID=A0A0D7ARZ8_9AGAR|nr:hypothetical protein CYLTODRAFT_460229 [Cylindrobasidium torrendii FP15055 ss-10]